MDWKSNACDESDLTGGHQRGIYAPTVSSAPQPVLVNLLCTEYGVLMSHPEYSCHTLRV